MMLLTHRSDHVSTLWRTILTNFVFLLLCYWLQRLLSNCTSAWLKSPPSLYILSFVVPTLALWIMDGHTISL
ncbi:hypothetical protein BJ546DRAFT_599378 [Cryomyces antarcticus]